MNITGNMSQERQTKLESEPKQSVKPMLQKPMLQKKTGHISCIRSGRPLLGRGHVTCLINHG